MAPDRRRWTVAQRPGRCERCTVVFQPGARVLLARGVVLCARCGEVAPIV